MAKVIFEFEIGEDDYFIRLHNNAKPMADAIEHLSDQIRAKMKHGDRAEIEKWWPFAKMFKDAMSGAGVDWTDFPGLYTDDTPPEFDPK